MKLLRLRDTEGNSQGFWPLVVIAMITSASAMIYLESHTDTGWSCTPVAADREEPVEAPCFRALLANPNTVSLQWRVADSDETVYIFDDKPPRYHDPGYQPPECAGGPEKGCAVDIAVPKGGSYRWTLRVGDKEGEQTHVAASIQIPPPPPPTATGGGFVDLMNARDQSFSWESTSTYRPADLEKAWIEIRYPDQMAWSNQRFPRSGDGASLLVPASTFTSAGDYIFAIRDCHLPVGSGRKFCSPNAAIGYKAGHDHFLGYNNRHVAAGEDLEVHFTTRSGNVRLLSSETIFSPDGPAMVVTTDSHYLISGERLTPGAHTLELNSCRLHRKECSNRVNAIPAAADGAVWHKLPGHFAEGETIATLYPADGSDSQSIPAPASGAIHFENPELIHQVASGDAIAYAITHSSDVLRLLVGAPVEWTLARDYTEDFQAASTIPAEGTGQALGITFDKNGGIWLLNEFSNNVEYVSPQGEMTSLNLPLARSEELSQQFDPSRIEPRRYYPVVKPFAFWWDPDTGGQTSITSLAEKILAVDSSIWFTQGGGLQTGRDKPWPNHSRVISFNPDITNSTTTPYDDRFCVYNMPADDPRGFGNNQIIGLAAARGRIWVAESRGLLNETQSYLSSFVPSADLCHNLLNFEDPEALAGQRLQYCEAGRTPEQDGCIERIPLPDAPKPLKIAHLVADPGESLLWFTDASGQCLVSFDIDGESGFSVKEIPDKHINEFETIGDLGGFPWDLQVDEGAIYAGEYASRHILRYDKQRGTFHEISIPHTGQEMRLHSMVIDHMRHRLWFTLANERPVSRADALSTIGYIDLNSWRAYIANPGSGNAIQGVVYKGLENIPAGALHPGQSQSFRGIALDPHSGTLALATMFREQIVLLKPHPGFWP